MGAHPRGAGVIPGFRDERLRVNGVEIAYSAGGEGKPLLLLHGFPQTRALWAKVVPLLAQGRRVIAADLRGYGASSKPEGVAAYSFREMGADMLALMQALGHDRFDLAGHDRGGRTAHRMALDAPERIRRIALLDIIPTRMLLSELTHDVARAYYHWFFLSQPAPLPERMIGADPDLFFESCLAGWGAARLEDFDPEQLAQYRAAWRQPQAIAGMCNDYRAAIDLDLALDTADLKRRLGMPCLVMWGENGAMGKRFDVAASWAQRFTGVRAAPVPGGHFFVDTAPEATARALDAFFAI